MQQPRREEFILDVRRSARTLRNPNVEADSDALDTDAIAKVLHRAALWLTPKVVERYDPDDFTNVPEEQQTRLRLAVDGFSEVAGQVSPVQTASIDQFMEGAERFRDLINVLHEIVLGEWKAEIETVESLAESWAEERNWRCRRVEKTITESLIGTYGATQLLVFAEPSLFVLDPVARFIPGGMGAFDLAIQPSYHTTSLFRGYDKVWYVNVSDPSGNARAQRVKWSKDTFIQCFEELKVLA